MKSLILLLVAALGTPVGLFALELKIFPPEAVVEYQGQSVKPISQKENVRTYDLPAGHQSLTLRCQGYQPKTLVLDLPLGKVVEEKLEPADFPWTKVGELKTGVQPKSVAFTVDGKYMIVPLLADSGIDVYQVEPFRYLKRLTPPGYGAKQGFVESGYLPSLKEIWVSQMTTGSIHVFDASTLDYKMSFKTGGDWSKVIAFSPDGKRGLVSNWESNSVSVFDTQERKLLGKVKTPGIPRGLAFSEDGEFFYAAIFDNGKVEKFRTGDLSRVGGFDFGEGSAMRHALAAFGRLYFSDMARGRAFAVDGASGKTLAQVPLGHNINTIALSPDGKTLAASSRGKNNPVDYTKKGPEYGKVFFVDTANFQVTGFLWGRNQPTGLAFSPDGRYLAFTDFLDDTLELYQLTPGKSPVGVPTR